MSEYFRGAAFDELASANKKVFSSLAVTRVISMQVLRQSVWIAAFAFLACLNEFCWLYSRRQNDQMTDVVKVGRDCGVDVAESRTCADTALLYHSLVFLYIVEVGRNHTRRASQAGDGSLQCWRLPGMLSSCLHHHFCFAGKNVSKMTYFVLRNVKF